MFCLFVRLITAADYPDIEIVIGAGGLSGDLSGAMRNMLGITDEFHRSVYRDLIGKPAFGLVPVLLRPNSRGRISLKSRNPFHWPRMEPNFFQNQTDVETLIKGVRAVILISKPFCDDEIFMVEMFPLFFQHNFQCLGVAGTKSFAKWKTRFNRRPFLGCENYIFGSDAYWECCIRRHAGSLQHQVRAIFKMGFHSIYNWKSFSNIRLAPVKWDQRAIRMQWLIQDFRCTVCEICASLTHR